MTPSFVEEAIGLVCALGAAFAVGDFAGTMAIAFVGQFFERRAGRQGDLEGTRARDPREECATRARRKARSAGEGLTGLLAEPPAYSRTMSGQGGA